MKKLLVLSMIILGTVAFARGGSPRDDREDSFRDYDYNERRDIVEPMQENAERMSRFTPQELEIEVIKAEENMEKYEDFHEELEKQSIGEERGSGLGGDDDRRDFR